MKVYVVIERKSEDYHGVYHEIVEIFDKELKANKKVEELSETNYNGNIEYYVQSYKVY